MPYLSGRDSAGSLQELAAGEFFNDLVVDSLTISSYYGKDIYKLTPIASCK